jgi:5-oxoprolinase (ATP-hydrolysing)
MNRNRWEFWIDRGGTFTDLVARRPDGTLTTHKLLSENPEQYSDAALQGIRDLMGIDPGASIPADRIRAIKMGTTVATNALLERKGEPTVLLTNAGFGDALEIGNQARPHLFKLRIDKPAMLYLKVIEVGGRFDAEGVELEPFAAAEAREQLEAAYREGFRAVAICFLHAYRYPAHEQAVARIASELGFTQISASHAVSPLMKFVPRGDTTVVDAYLSPILRRYVDRIATELEQGSDPDCRLMFMQSSGGLTDSTLFQGKDAILSGPAGGVIGAIQSSTLAGFDRIIGFDMGGTSTDVCHYAGELERSFDTEVDGIRLRAPMMQIHTVAAGGGSILSFDGSRLRVGPASAGANPGPACYRRGGPLTVTDANLMVGKLLPDYFPRTFGRTADQPLDAKVVQRKFQALAAEMGDGHSPEFIADGFLQIAVENMAQAIKKISVQRGHDISKYTLTCFGGAGGQHACLVADALGMTRVFIHPYSGVLSAYGMGLAELSSTRERAIEAPFTSTIEPELDQISKALTDESSEELQQQGLTPAQIRTVVRLHLRYEGTDTALIVARQSLDQTRAAFEAMHRQRFGFITPGRPIIVEALSVESSGRDHEIQENAAQHEPRNTPLQAASHHPFYSGGHWHRALVYRRGDVRPSDKIPGPAILIEDHQTIVIEPGWQAEVTRHDHIVLERQTALPKRYAIGTDVDPIMLEIFNNRFMSVAEQMGITLEQTAVSVNIKERLDFSCAVFDAAGALVANAPHVPVHLGSMGASVRTVIDQNPDMQPGDVYVLNAPYNGGTHLPDVTVVAPVYDADEQQRLFYVAARGHQADIGGISPGSMPAHSTHVDEEGVLIDNFKLVDRGHFKEGALRSLLSSGSYPARNPDQNIADLRAQIAACRKGALELLQLVSEFSLDVVQAYMQHVQDNAEASVRRVIGVLQRWLVPAAARRWQRDPGGYSGQPCPGTARIDFSGTSPTQSNNLNAPAAVTYAAVLYVFRCLVDDEIPLNAGCLKPLEIILPDGSMLAPSYPAAVVGGNVETSQAVTNALFGALGVMASAQGTMNNFSFGNDRHQYYETIGGGAGAGPDFDGADAVHTHMTNSRLTDPEVLEWRYPVLLERFAVRRGSGGRGQHRGGDGIDRVIRFREAMEVALLTTHRKIAPFGLNGGEAGQPGRNRLLSADGTAKDLPPSAQVRLKAGDAIQIETPGGGGFGAA